MKKLSKLEMTDCISQEIYKNRKYISQNGLIKFYQKSKFLSKVWEIYKKQFDESYNLFQTDNILAPAPPDEYILRPFKFIIVYLKYYFDSYYKKRELIYEKIKIEPPIRDVSFINYMRFGKKTRHYNLLESEVSRLVDDLFTVPNAITQFQAHVFKAKYTLTEKQLQKRIDNRKEGSSKKSNDPVLNIYSNIINVMKHNKKITVMRACCEIFDQAYNELPFEEFGKLYSDGDFQAFYSKFLSFYKNNRQKYPTEYQIIEDHKQKKSDKKVLRS